MIVIGYWTGLDDYRVMAEAMRASVERHDIDCHIIHRTPPLDTSTLPKPMPWVVNCSLCASVIQEAMNLFPNQSILYLDADAEMVEHPSLFFSDWVDGVDFAAPMLPHRNRIELVSNTLYFAPTRLPARELVRQWEELQGIRLARMLAGGYSRPYREAWDQTVLQSVLESGTVPGLSWKALPLEYARIDPTSAGKDFMSGVGNGIICQHQASRQTKKRA